VLAAVKTKPSAALNRAGLDRRCARRLLDRAAGTEECSAGAEPKNGK
jgi:DNA-directed RNA polymerase subunit N (RpoN/RPB10)